MINEEQVKAFTEVVEALGLDEATELVHVVSGGNETLAADLRHAWIRNQQEGSDR